MANGGMYGEGEEEKKYSWLEKKIVTKAKKGHVHQTPGARFIRTNSIVKNGKVMGSKGWLRIVGRNKQKKEGTYRFHCCWLRYKVIIRLEAVEGALLLLSVDGIHALFQLSTSSLGFTTSAAFFLNSLQG